jgi:hypothetical protein
MGHAFKTIAIHQHTDQATSATGCGACAHSASDGPVCTVVVGEEGAAPQLSGPADEVQRLLGALGRQLGYPADGAGLVRVLRVQPGEVDLQLAVAHCHGGAALCDSAFQTLRGLLPDTDIYVSPAG